MKLQHDLQQNKKSSTTLDLVQVGLMAAMTFIATSIIHIPSNMGVIHLGDSIIFIAAILIGRKKGAAASAIGMCLFDVVHGYTLWAPFTFVIKGVMAYIAAIIAHRGRYAGKSFLNNLIAFTIAGLWMIGAYYFSGAIMASFLTGKAATFSAGLVLAIKDIPGNIAQVVAGIVIALPIVSALRKYIKQ